MSTGRVLHSARPGMHFAGQVPEILSPAIGHSPTEWVTGALVAENEAAEFVNDDDAVVSGSIFSCVRMTARIA